MAERARGKIRTYRPDAPRYLLVVPAVLVLVSFGFGAVAKLRGQPSSEPWRALFAAGWFAWMGVLFWSAVPDRWLKPFAVATSVGFVFCLVRAVAPG